MKRNVIPIVAAIGFIVLAIIFVKEVTERRALTLEVEVLKRQLSLVSGPDADQNPPPGWDVLTNGKTYRWVDNDGWRSLMDYDTREEAIQAAWKRVEDRAKPDKWKPIPKSNNKGD